MKPEPTWVQWRGSKVHAAVLDAFYGRAMIWTLKILCGWSWQKAVKAQGYAVVERGPNPCRRCLAAIERGAA